MSRFRWLLVLCAVGLFTSHLFGQAIGDNEPADKRDALPDGARARLGNPGLGIGDFVRAAALSPDGKYLALAGSTGVSLLDRATGKPLTQIGNNNLAGLTEALAFAPTGNVIACGSFRDLFLAEVPTGKQLHRLTVNDPKFQRPHGISFSADGKVVAVGMDYGFNQKLKAFAWDVASGKSLGEFEVLQDQNCSAALSPDGKRLATWGRHIGRGMIGKGGPIGPADREPSQIVQIWDIATGKEEQKIKIDRPFAQVNSVVFSPDGKTLVVSSGMSTFHMIDSNTGKEKRSFAGRRAQMSRLEFSPDGKLLVAAGGDGLIQAWRTDNGDRLDLAAPPQGRLMSLAFPAEGK